MVYNTEQRSVLLAFLSQNPDKTFSAKEIAAALCDKNISKSAVYRNLSELESDEKIKRIPKSGSREVFYQYFDIQACKNHIHLSCKKCGTIFHLDENEANKISSLVETNDNFKLCFAETTLYGVCKKCHD